MLPAILSFDIHDTFSDNITELGNREGDQSERNVFDRCIEAPPKAGNPVTGVPDRGLAFRKAHQGLGDRQRKQRPRLPVKPDTAGDGK